MLSISSTGLKLLKRKRKIGKKKRRGRQMKNEAESSSTKIIPDK